MILMQNQKSAFWFYRFVQIEMYRTLIAQFKPQKTSLKNFKIIYLNSG